MGRSPASDALSRSSIPRSAAVHPQRASRPAARADAAPNPPTDNDHPDRGRDQRRADPRRDSLERDVCSTRRNRASARLRNRPVTPRVSDARERSPRLRAVRDRRVRSPHRLGSLFCTGSRPARRRSSRRRDKVETSASAHRRAGRSYPPRRQSRECAQVATGSATKQRSTSSSSTSATSRASTGPRFVTPLNITRSSPAATACSSSSNAPSGRSAPYATSAGEHPRQGCFARPTSSRHARTVATSISTTSGHPPRSRRARTTARFRKTTTSRARAASSPTSSYGCEPETPLGGCSSRSKVAPSAALPTTRAPRSSTFLAYRRAYAPVLDEQNGPVRPGLCVGSWTMRQRPKPSSRYVRPTLCRARLSCCSTRSSGTTATSWGSNGKNENRLVEATQRAVLESLARRDCPNVRANTQLTPGFQRPSVRHLVGSLGCPAQRADKIRPGVFA